MTPDEIARLRADFLEHLPHLPEYERRTMARQLAGYMNEQIVKADFHLEQLVTPEFALAQEIFLRLLGFVPGPDGTWEKS